ncbi:MAG: alanine racemase [Phycisphaeraceae bacterium]|nr:alanine racemase [Phycisphaeraceae bacterium]
MNPTSWLEINFAQLDANVAAFRAMIGHAKLCGVIKADAYGLGVVPIARRLTSQVEMLAVYSPAQAEQLAGLALTCPVLVFMRLAELTRGHPLYRMAVTGQLHLTIHDCEQAALLDEAGRRLGCRIPIHLYLDTGMSRGGLNAEQFRRVMIQTATFKHLLLAGVYTHMASAESDESFTHEQMACVDRALADFKDKLPADLIVHVANTYATLRDSRFHRGMVRIGLGLWGYGLEDLQGEGPWKHLHRNREPLNSGSSSVAWTVRSGPAPVLRWRSRLIHIQEHKRQTPVGYGSTHVLTRDSVLGLVPVGYADGYPRSLTNTSVVSLPESTVDGKPLTAPVIGRVNMDQIVIDLTDVPASVGSLVELISGDPDSPCALPTLARQAGTNTYEMLCRLSPRITRRYIS